MGAAVPQVLYPKVNLWESRFEEEDRLQIINERDFPQQEILESLGLDKSSLRGSFGICDDEEIKSRHALVAFLLDNPDFFKWIRNLDSSTSLPTSEDAFLNFYDPNLALNPFWQQVYRFLDLVKGDNVPPKLGMIADTLRAALELQEPEKQMATTIAERLQSVSAFEGLMEFNISLEINEREPTDEDPRWKTVKIDDLDCWGEDHVFGHQQYSFSLNDLRQEHAPDWAFNWKLPWNWLGLGAIFRLVAHNQNQARRNRAFQGMVIRGLSKRIRPDITSAVRKRLEAALDEGQLELLKNGQVTVYVDYSKEGLKVAILDVKAEYQTLEEGTSTNDPFQNFFKGYSGEQRTQIEKARKVYWQEMSGVMQGNTTNEIRAALLEFDNNFFGRRINVPAPTLDTQFRWFAISNMYQGAEFGELYDALKDLRSFFQTHCNRLKTVADVVHQITVKAKKLKVPVCVPEVVDNGHVISFAKLYPTHLLFRLRPDQVVPINKLPELNGQMIGLTGEHGGGKTETQISVVVNIFLAQSGLPVFGEYFRFNVKKVLGMVFIAERGKGGSTCEMVLDKIKNVLEGIKGMPGREVVLVLDEVGTGTQEIAGFELGRDLLLKLADQQISVLFSTQITSLAEFAASDLSAMCFKLDDKHRVSEGIGDGGMDRLRKKKGLDKLLRGA
mgnify:FL=1